MGSKAEESGGAGPQPPGASDCRQERRRRAAGVEPGALLRSPPVPVTARLRHLDAIFDRPARPQGAPFQLSQRPGPGHPALQYLPLAEVGESPPGAVSRLSRVASPTEPKHQRGHCENRRPHENQLSRVSHPLSGATQNSGYECITHECVPWREFIGLRTIRGNVPADLEIHRMQGGLEDLPCHREKIWIIDQERLAEERQEAKRSHDQRRERANKHPPGFRYHVPQWPADSHYANPCPSKLT